MDLNLPLLITSLQLIKHMKYYSCAHLRQPLLRTKYGLSSTKRVERGLHGIVKKNNT